MKGTIDITRFESVESIDRAQWNALVEQSATQTVFQTHEWHIAWSETLQAGRETVLLRATQNGTLAGIAAFVLDGGILRFAGDGDYADVICSASATGVRAELLRTALDYGGASRRAELVNVPAKSPTTKLLAGTDRSIQTSSTPCPRLTISGHPEMLDDVLRKKSLRRHHGHFSKQANYTVEHLTRATEIRLHLEAFFAQHIGRWSNTPFPSLFQSERQRRFYRALTEAFDASGWLRFTRLAVNGQPVAFHFGFVFRNELVWYKPSFEASLARRSPGEALLFELFRLAGDERLDAFDFTIGNESFKSRFANEFRENLHWKVHGRVGPYWIGRTKAEIKTRFPGAVEWLRRLRVRR